MDRPPSQRYSCIRLRKFRVPPKAVRKPKRMTLFTSLTLYISASFSWSSALLTLALSGWITSTTNWRLERSALRMNLRVLIWTAPLSPAMAASVPGADVGGEESLSEERGQPLVRSRAEQAPAAVTTSLLLTPRRLQ